MQKKPIEIGLIGASGKFGQSILHTHLEASQHHFSQLIGQTKVGQFDPLLKIPYKKITALTFCDLLIEIASPQATEFCLEFCKNHKIPCIIGSTGHSLDLLQKIELFSESIPIFFCQNFSLVLQLYLDMIKLLAPHAQTNCYIDLIEKHRFSKKDSPSGTAKKIAQELNMPYKLGGIEQQRDSKILQIHSIRGQDHSIEHELRLGFAYEELSIKHQVFDRKAYAQGVLHAIDFIYLQKPGLYGMKDLTKKLLNEALNENS